MTNRPNMHVGDYGTTFEMQILNRSTKKALNISTALVKKFIFSPPTHDTFERTAVFVGTGTDGKLKYVIEDGDIDEEGEWQIQVLVQDALGQWHSDIEVFEVGANLVVEVS
jgi:hypothetical protein